MYVFLEKYENLSLNYTQYSLLSGALRSCFISFLFASTHKVKCANLFCWKKQEEMILKNFWQKWQC